MTINNTQRFLTELERIASKFEWFLSDKKYGQLICQQIVGVRERAGESNEYIPLTAVVEEATGRYYDPSLFDKAAGEVFMSAQVATQILDACDEWPDRSSKQGYKPKNYEVKLRQSIIEILKL
jgi:hypothetical protein